VYLYQKDTISGVHHHVSPGSTETLVMRDGVTNHHLIAYCLSNVSAKSYQTCLMCIEVIACNTSVVFLRHSVGESGWIHCDNYVFALLVLDIITQPVLQMCFTRSFLLVFADEMSSVVIVEINPGLQRR